MDAGSKPDSPISGWKAKPNPPLAVFNDLAAEGAKAEPSNPVGYGWPRRSDCHDQRARFL